jgi:hypothetical protein
VQIFDQKKFKKKDQGFLGVINVRVSDVLDLGDGSREGMEFFEIHHEPLLIDRCRDAHTGSQEIYG